MRVWHALIATVFCGISNISENLKIFDLAQTDNLKGTRLVIK